MSERFPQSRIERTDLVRAAFEKARALLEQAAIKVDDFHDRYGEKRVTAAHTYIRQREASFEKARNEVEEEAMKLGTVLEALIHQHGEQSNWFGENARTIKTSKFDDYRGVDEVIEFNEDTGTSHLALAVDIASSRNVEGKFFEIRDKINTGEMAHVEYFEGGDNDFIGELRNIPKVVVGADAKTVRGLAELWVDGKNTALAAHPVQFQILEEILMQCRAFAEFAKARHQNLAEEKYENAAEIISGILADKKKQIRDSGERDTSFVAIQAAVARFRKPR